MKKLLGILVLGLGLCGITSNRLVTEKINQELD